MSIAKKFQCVSYKVPCTVTEQCSQLNYVFFVVQYRTQRQMGDGILTNFPIEDGIKSLTLFSYPQGMYQWLCSKTLKNCSTSLENTCTVHISVFQIIFSIYHILLSGGVKWRQWKEVGQKNSSARDSWKPSVYINTMLQLMIWQNMTKAAFTFFMPIKMNTTVPSCLPL